MKKVIIIGGSGIGMIAASIIERCEDLELLGFINDFIPIGNKIGINKKIPVIGNTDQLNEFITQPDCFFFFAFAGFHDPKLSFQRIKELAVPREKLINIIDPSAMVPFDYIQMGKSILIGPNCQISPDTVIEDYCILFGGNWVGHDTTLKEFVHLNANSVVGSYTLVEKGSTIGLNATVKGDLEIKAFSFVGAGAVLLDDVTEETIVVGNPARFLRKRTSTELRSSGK